ncbi:CaiB/BaiF CoA-transferase family protein [Ramlibacter sp. 2FC]|uniref:CaiB/BaiF CoA transferase family protein n=1 Tax=Ramlibacter sp. 2FC TaxID=2502188 RepID=UPI0010F97695|nr:CaiB/BaiF CoA-transferase family protein [Ramlibacter sp. 2FC]
MGSPLTAVTPPLPLSGVRVLDLGHVFQGPYASFLLAMAGAEVIKIEAPHGDMSRNRNGDGDYPFRALNGCKRGIVLNLKTERGRGLLLEMAKSADVVMENFSPGVMSRLGLAPDAFLQVNPRIIYASASGFGSTGPYAGNLALDLTIQAVSGMMSTTGESGSRPMKTGVPVADFMSGAHFYGAVVTALYERERTGRGRVVEVSMLESLFCTMLPAAGYFYAHGKSPQRTGNRHIANAYVPYDIFEAQDGWVAIVAATDDHWLGLARAMARPDLANDDALRTSKGRVERIEELTNEIAVWVSRHTRRTVTELLQAHRVPSAPLQSVDEVLVDRQLHARGFLTEHQTEKGTVALPNSPMRFGDSPLRELQPPPDLGQHTDEVLEQLCGLRADELAALRRAGVIA